MAPASPACCLPPSPWSRTSPKRRSRVVVDMKITTAVWEEWAAWAAAWVVWEAWAEWEAWAAWTCKRRILDCRFQIADLLALKSAICNLKSAMERDHHGKGKGPETSASGRSRRCRTVGSRGKNGG